VISVEKLKKFPTPCILRSHCRGSRWNWVPALRVKKLERRGYRAQQGVSRCLQPCGYNAPTWRTVGRTDRQTPGDSKDRASGMWVSRPGLGLETDQDHFFEVLVLVSALLVLILVLVLASLVLVSVLVSACLVLVSKVVLSKTWGYVRPQRYLCRKSKLAS